MTQRMQYQVEMVGETATLYVSGALGREDAGTLVQLCAGMPALVRTLRLDLHGLGQLSAEAIATVRLLLLHWQQSRHGEFRLSTSHLLATLREVAVVPAPYEPTMRPHLNEALTAAYL
jgi:ABC-type transporter Mla MlaB component